MKKISSADNPRVKLLVKLARSARERRKAGMSLLDGAHLVSAYLQTGSKPELVAVSDAGLSNNKIINIINDLKDSHLLQLSDALFESLSSVESPTGIMAAIKTPELKSAAASTGACVLLDDIQDPGNLGSILRSAAAANVSNVYLSKGCTDAWSPRTLRAGMGAHFALRIFERIDLVEFARRYKGKLFAASHEAKQSVFNADLTGNIAFIFGNEGAGISTPLSKAAHIEAAIPMPGKAESLNVAAAAAICLFERVRQHALVNKS